MGMRKICHVVMCIWVHCGAACAFPASLTPGKVINGHTSRQERDLALPGAVPLSTCWKLLPTAAISVLAKKGLPLRLPQLGLACPCTGQLTKATIERLYSSFMRAGLSQLAVLSVALVSFMFVQACFKSALRFGNHLFVPNLVAVGVGCSDDTSFAF